ncbi:MAG: HAMP domain-containing sensor histidine kinase [bacterium]
MKSRKEVCFVVCNYFIKEVKHIIELDKITNADVISFPNACDKPEPTKKAIENFVHERINDYEQIFVLSSCSKRFSELMENNKVNYLPADNCFEILLNKNLIEYYFATGYYILTRTWLQSYHHKFAEWGFDRNTIRDFFNESARKLLFLDTGIEPIDTELLNELSEAVNLPYEILPIGIEYLRLIINQKIMGWENHKKEIQLKDTIAKLNMEKADYALISEKLIELSSFDNREQVLEKLFELFTLLCAPSMIVYLPVKDNRAGTPIVKKIRDYENTDLQLLEFDKIKDCETAQDIFIEISHLSKVLGLVFIGGVMFPQYKNHYKNLAASVSNVVGLALANAEKYQLLKSSEIQLQKSSVELHKINTTKDKLFSIIAHDLRSPFSGLMGYSDFLLENFDQMTAEDKKIDLNLLNQAIKDVYSLIDNLLTWSRSQTDKIEFKPSRIYLKHVIGRVFNALNIPAANKKINLKFICHDELNIIADPNMVETVIRNLVNNAIKFTNENGWVNVNIQDGESKIIIAVEDNGIGMDEEISASLFKLSTQITRQGTAHERGSGLGLLICKEFIERHNGEITVKSAVNAGTVISFTVPK